MQRIISGTGAAITISLSSSSFLAANLAKGAESLQNQRIPHTS
jgi:hypothetical protein